MGERQTITINGRVYDAITGLPADVVRQSRQALRTPQNVQKKTRRISPATTSSNVHSALKTSARIDSRFAKKPLAKRKLAYEKYGAKAEAAITAAIQRRAEDKAKAKIEEAARQPVAAPAARQAVTSSAAKPTPKVVAQPAAQPSTAASTTKAAVKTTPLSNNAHIPAPAPVPTKPATAQKPSPLATPANKATDPTLDAILTRNYNRSRIDDFNAKPQVKRATSNLKPKSLDSRRSLQPVQPRSNHASPTYNIPNQMRPASNETAMAHPVVERAQAIQKQRQAIKQQPAATQQPASVLKSAIVNETLDNAPKSNYRKHKARPSKKRARMLSFASGFAALALFAGYVTYLNVPNISVRVAAAQAGIDASYPGYQPNGYRLNGPVAYSNGEVKMNFISRQDGSEYTLRESRSSWNSSTLLENYVREASKDDYIISKEKGITVYHYNGDAAWVSGGILYIIDGGSHLTPEDVRNIATSV